MVSRNLFALCLVMVLMVLPAGPLAHAEQAARIDPIFFHEVKDSSAWIDVVLELRDLPGIEYWQLQYAQTSMELAPHRSSLLEDTRAYQEALAKKQDELLAWASRKKLSLIPGHRLSLTLNAITAEVMGTDIEVLASCPMLYKIHDARMSLDPIRYLGSKSTGAEKAWAGLAEEQIASLSGKGMLVGVMDTGLDLLHPEFAREGKVKGGYNIADDNEDLSDSSSHGTHVAGIAVGQGSKDAKQGRGMAYDAQVMVYKIFSKNSSGSADLLVAMERVVKDGCDVLNCSFGASSSDYSTGDSAFHRSIRNVDKAGTLVVAGSGNSGARRKEVPWPILIPSIIDTAFSVGGTDDRKEGPFLSVQLHSRTERVIQAIHTPHSRTMTNSLFTNGIVDAGYGLADELKRLDLQDKVALIQRGPNQLNVSFRDKLENALQGGAVGVIFYNNAPHQNTPFHILKPGEGSNSVLHLPPSISLSKEDGEYIKTAIERGAGFAIDYRQFSTIASFSSMGLSGDSAFKPEITAPATQIVSTIPGGKYATMAGTSFSTPMITGLVALLKEARPTWTHPQIKSALMNTADIMINPFNQLPVTFTLQGAGTARLDKAIQTPAFLEPRALVLSNTSEEVSQTFSVTNASDKQQHFALSTEFFHLNHETLPLSVVFDRQELTVEKGQKASFSVTFRMDRSAFLQNRYEGIIKLGDELHIPLICYRNPGHLVEDAVSNIRLSQDSLDLRDADVLEQSPVQISFSLNAGNLSSRVTKDYTSFTGVNYGNVDIYVFDEAGEEWGKIASFSNIMVGEYTFLWNGKDAKQELFLPRGRFYLHFLMTMREHKNQEWTSYPYGPFRKAFHVAESKLPEPMPVRLSTLKMYADQDTVTLGFRFDATLGQIPVDELIGRIEFKLLYSAQHLSLEQAHLRGFLDAEAGIELLIDADTEGALGIAILCEDLPADKLTEQNFLVLEFSIKDRGRIAFTPRSFWIQGLSQKSYKGQAFEVASRISSRSFLLCDLNGDKIVDRHDFSIFMASFGSRAGEEAYNELCDFNQDRRIDLIDLIIMAKETGKYL